MDWWNYGDWKRFGYGRGIFLSKVWKLAVHIALATFVNNLALFSMNTSIENISSSLEWETSYAARSFFPSLYPAGMFFGTLIAVPLSNRFGIRKMIISGDFIFIIGSLLSMMPNNLTLGLGRSISGVIGGIFLVLPPVFINEITPDEMTGPVST
jgi:MFS family permease